MSTRDHYLFGNHIGIERREETRGSAAALFSCLTLWNERDHALATNQDGLGPLPIVLKAQDNVLR